jgi:hypothetical protein
MGWPVAVSFPEIVQLLLSKRRAMGLSGESSEGVESAFAYRIFCSFVRFLPMMSDGRNVTPLRASV